MVSTFPESWGNEGNRKILNAVKTGGFFPPLFE